MELIRSQTRLRILFVDDEENVLRALKRLFIDQEFEIHTATSGEKGLEILKENKIAVIVSDMRMPEMNGAEFLERTRQLSPDSARIVLTGYANVNATIDAINKGGTYRYVTKPWNDDEILATVRDAAEKYRLLQENKYLIKLTYKQNEKLKKWSSELKAQVQEQTIELESKNGELLELNGRLKTDFRGFVITMANLLELREKTVASHSNNVAIISRKMAATMGLGDTDIQDVAIAGQLHDIGKIGISDAVLSKEVEAMTPFEFREYESHSVRGQAAIDSIDALRVAGVLIRHHHESFKGGGFPDGLEEDQIPLGSRILAIADKFDRLLAHHSMKEALEKISNLANTQFDPNLCQVLAKIAGEVAGSDRRAGRTVESELHPDQLASGMILSRDVRSGTGVLLLPQGVGLSLRAIDVIKRYCSLDPPRTGIYVWSEGL